VFIRRGSKPLIEYAQSNARAGTLGRAAALSARIEAKPDDESRDLAALGWHVAASAPHETCAPNSCIVEVADDLARRRNDPTSQHAKPIYSCTLGVSSATLGSSWL